jgi:heptosyltransferase II
MTRILVIAPSWVGDAVLSQPLLARIKAREPEAVIDVLAPGWALPIFRRMDETGSTLESPFAHGELALLERRRLGHRLRETGYDRAYVLPNSFKSALVPAFARIPERIGYAGEMRYGLLTDARRLDANALPLMVERFANLADPAGATLARPVPVPRLRVSARERDSIIGRLGLAPPRNLVCLCPGAEYGPAKRWPPEYFADLAATLDGQGRSVWVIGSAKEHEIGAAIESGSRGAAISLCGRTTLDDAVVLLSAAQSVVSNDSGLMHVAAALGRPMVALYGSSSPAFTPPLSPLARIVSLDLDCSPCFKRACPLKHFNCMMQLAPARVLDELNRLSVS